MSFSFDDIQIGLDDDDLDGFAPQMILDDGSNNNLPIYESSGISSGHNNAPLGGLKKIMHDNDNNNTFKIKEEEKDDMSFNKVFDDVMTGLRNDNDKDEFSPQMIIDNRNNALSTTLLQQQQQKQLLQLQQQQQQQAQKPVVDTNPNLNIVNNTIMNPNNNANGHQHRDASSSTENALLTKLHVQQPVVGGGISNPTTINNPNLNLVNDTIMNPNNNATRNGHQHDDLLLQVQQQQQKQLQVQQPVVGGGGNASTTTINNPNYPNNIANGHQHDDASANTDALLLTGALGERNGFEIQERFTMNGKKKALSFPLKLMKVLSMNEYQHIVSWSPDGTQFQIVDRDEFTETVLNKHFKQAKYPSFTRKLSRWGFERVGLKRSKRYIKFRHPLFQKDRFDLADHMAHRLLNYDYQMPPPQQATLVGSGSSGFGGKFEPVANTTSQPGSMMMGGGEDTTMKGSPVLMFPTPLMQKASATNDDELNKLLELPQELPWVTQQQSEKTEENPTAAGELITSDMHMVQQEQQQMAAAAVQQKRSPPQVVPQKQTATATTVSSSALPSGIDIMDQSSPHFETLFEMEVRKRVLKEKLHRAHMYKSALSNVEQQIQELCSSDPMLQNFDAAAATTAPSTVGRATTDGNSGGVAQLVVLLAEQQQQQQQQQQGMMTNDGQQHQHPNNNPFHFGTGNESSHFGGGGPSAAADCFSYLPNAA